MTDKTPNNPAEIDLLYFFRPFGKGIIKIWNALVYSFRKVFYNKILFAAVVLITTIAGYSLRFLIPPAFQTQGIFVSNVLSGKFCSVLLKNLNSLKSEENKPELAVRLGLSLDATLDISSITLKNMRDTFTLEKRDTALSVFTVTLVLKRMDHLDSIQWALVNYLENNEFAVKRKQARRNALEKLRETLSTKLESLDSLKQIVNSSIIPRSEGRGIILGEPVNPVSVYQAEIAYYKEQLAIDEALATIDNIEIIQPFFKINRPNHPRYNYMMAVSFVIGLFLAFIVVLWLGKKPV